MVCARVFEYVCVVERASDTERERVKRMCSVDDDSDDNI